MNYRVKAGALFLVLIIAMIIAILCSSVIMLSYFNRTQVTTNRIYLKLQNNCESGLNLLMTNPDTLFAKEGLKIDLFMQGNDSVFIKKGNWGVFQYLYAKAAEKGSEVKICNLMGLPPQYKEKKFSIYLCDYGRPISVCGNTKIIGDIYTSDAGIKREYSPVPFAGIDLFKGIQHKSEGSLPKYNHAVINQILNLYKLPSSNHKNEQGNSDTLENSFENPCIVLNIGKKTSLPFKVLKGNVIITADSVINIYKNQICEDVIVLARSITFQSGFKGKGQFYAFDSICTDNQVNLSYPSVLGVLKNDFRYTKPFIKVKNGTNIKGFIFGTHLVQDLAGTYIKIEKEATLEGDIYSEGFTEVNGKVYGSVMTSKFILNTSSSIYENYLMDAEIDVSKRHSRYIGTYLLNTKAIPQIVKSLY